MFASITRYRAVPVWVGIVRLTHWINAIGILLLLALGTVIGLHAWLQIPDARVDLLTDIHAAIGFMVAASLLIRIAYLFAGEGTGHWRDVLPHRQQQFVLVRDTLRYYLRGFRGNCPLYFGHNPLAGFAYSGFFVLAALQVMTGAIMYLLGDAVTPAYAHSAHAGAGKWPPAWLLQIHETGAWLIAAFIVAHLSALALHDIVERRGLASSMISGYKFFSDEELARLPEGNVPPVEEEQHGDSG